MRQYNCLNIKKFQLFISLALIIFAVLSAATCFMIYSVNKNLLQNNQANNQKFSLYDLKNAHNQYSRALYKICEYNGSIAIYDCVKDEIMEITEVRTFTLPESDRNDLISGIYIYSESELVRIIQDFTS